tara:strand:+ start:20700 stop:22460 length:1761 start_codon:yes stop_codon:yes gene_type:complete
MDYSKVNNALSGWQGSSSRRDRQQAELGQAMQLMQMNQNVQADREAKEQRLNDWMQQIQTQASQIAVRNEDKEIVQGLYDQEKNTFLAELEKAGNDPVKFMNSGGRKTMQNFYNNIVNSDEVGRIRGNTQQIQAYFENLEGEDGKNSHLISHQSRRDFNAFMEGHIDSYNHKQLVDWAQPAKEDMEGSSSKVQAFLSTDNNYQVFKQNYIIEYDLPSSAMVDGSVSEQALENYVAQYVGGGNPQAALASTGGQGGVVNKSYGARVNKQFKKFKRKAISTDVIGSQSSEYSMAIKDFDSGRFMEGQGPSSTDIVGHRGFEGDELIFAQMQFGENAVPDLDGDTYIDSVVSDGTMYDENGALLPSGFEIGSIQPQGVYMGYKVKTKDGYKLVKADDLEGNPQDAEHVLMQEYQDDDWFTGKERYYIEVDTENATKMAMLSKEKGIDTALGRYTAESGSEEVSQQEQMPSISFDSTTEQIQPQLQNYDAQMTTTMKQMGLASNNVVSRSLLMALSSGSGNIQQGMGQLVGMFNPESSPEIHQALVEGNSKAFFDLYLQGLVSQGVDQQQAIQHLMKVDSLRDKIQKAYN